MSTSISEVNIKSSIFVNMRVDTSISRVNINIINICQFEYWHLHFKGGNWYHHHLSIWVPITATFQTFAIERWVRMVERMKGLAMLLEIISFFHLHCSWEEPSCEGGLCQGSTMMVRQTIILFRICILGEKHFDIW